MRSCFLLFAVVQLNLFRRYGDCKQNCSLKYYIREQETFSRNLRTLFTLLKGNGNNLIYILHMHIINIRNATVKCCKMIRKIQRKYTFIYLSLSLCLSLVVDWEVDAFLNAYIQCVLNVATFIIASMQMLVIHSSILALYHHEYIQAVHCEFQSICSSSQKEVPDSLNQILQTNSVKNQLSTAILGRQETK